MNRLVAIAGAALVGATIPILTPAPAAADGCIGWNGGYWFNTSTCTGGYYGDGCSSLAIGPFWSSQCNNPVLPPQQYYGQPWQP
jgi:hypothetical protein